MTDVRDVLLLRAPSTTKVARRCSSAALSRSSEVIVGQTWDLNPPIGFRRRRPPPSHHGPETWSITCAGALSLTA